MQLHHQSLSCGVNILILAALVLTTYSHELDYVPCLSKIYVLLELSHSSKAGNIANLRGMMLQLDGRITQFHSLYVEKKHTTNTLYKAGYTVFMVKQGGGGIMLRGMEASQS